MFKNRRKYFADMSIYATSAKKAVTKQASRDVLLSRRNCWHKSPDLRGSSK